MSYNVLAAGTPRDKRYSVTTLRAEILRYKELLDGVGPSENRGLGLGGDGGGSGGIEGASSIVGGVYEPYRTRGDIGGTVETRDYRYTSSTTTSRNGGIGGGVTVTSTADYTLRDERGSRTGVDYAMQRSAQGNVTIGRVARDGSYVTVENTSPDIDQHIGEWTLRSTSSSLKQVSYTFPRGFILAPRSTVQVFARGKGIHDPPCSLVCEVESTFATGEDLAIYLYDNNNEERACLTQRGFFATGGDSAF
ncbi:unnamed protein product [Cylicocyclus nassatus]|uniref:LTD domain-containing protein n=1 Tax=Cylicocyclus nassatus TaxID=53992 RepID=A0AA36MHZ5_CYLNA|nr:unnamed protein product [Cylicocyclus nassatus]